MISSLLPGTVLLVIPYAPVTEICAANKGDGEPEKRKSEQEKEEEEQQQEPRTGIYVRCRSVRHDDHSEQEVSQRQCTFPAANLQNGMGNNHVGHLACQDAPQYDCIRAFPAVFQKTVLLMTQHSGDPITVIGLWSYILRDCGGC